MDFDLLIKMGKSFVFNKFHIQRKYGFIKWLCCIMKNEMKWREKKNTANRNWNK